MVPMELPGATMPLLGRVPATCRSVQQAGIGDGADHSAIVGEAAALTTVPVMVPVLRRFRHWRGCP